MKKSMKWIIGIIIGLVIVVVLVGLGFMIFNHSYGNQWTQGRMYMSFDDEFDMHGRGFGLLPNGRGLYNFGDFGIRRFFPFASFLGSIFCIGIITLIILGIVALFRNLQKPAQPVQRTQPPMPPSVEPAISQKTTIAPIENAIVKEPIITPVESDLGSDIDRISDVPSSVPSSVKTCSVCSFPLQENWKHCPNCGTDLSGTST
jgi:hypothetical protein